MQNLLEKLEFYQSPSLEGKSLIAAIYYPTKEWMILGLLTNEEAERLLSSSSSSSWRFVVLPTYKWFSSPFPQVSVNSDQTSLVDLWFSYRQSQNELNFAFQSQFEQLHSTFEKNPVIEETWPIEVQEYFKNWSETSQNTGISINSEWEPTLYLNTYKETTTSPIPEITIEAPTPILIDSTSQAVTENLLPVLLNDEENEKESISIHDQKLIPVDESIDLLLSHDGQDNQIKEIQCPPVVEAVEQQQLTESSVVLESVEQPSPEALDISDLDQPAKNTHLNEDVQMSPSISQTQIQDLVSPDPDNSHPDLKQENQVEEEDTEELKDVESLLVVVDDQTDLIDSKQEEAQESSNVTMTATESLMMTKPEDSLENSILPNLATMTSFSKKRERRKKNQIAFEV